MNKVKLAVISLAVLIGVATLVPASYVSADAVGEIRKGSNAVGGSDAPSLGSRIEDVVNILLYLLGAVAVVMIVIGGIRYATSNGDSSAITGAKNTILYSVIGLIVAILAYAIVNFVLDAF